MNKQELLAAQYQAHLQALGKKVRVEIAGPCWLEVHSKSWPVPPFKVRVSQALAQIAAGKPLAGKPCLQWS